MNTIFKVVPGYSRYEVSSCGKIIRKIEGGRVLKQSVTAEGYLQVKLWGEDGVRYNVKVHRAVSFAFHGDPPTPDHDQVRHLDGDKRNNDVGNLKWGTRQENAEDTVRLGEQAHGKRYVLSQADRDVIRGTTLPVEVIMNRYGISESTAYRYMSGSSRRRKPRAKAA